MRSRERFSLLSTHTAQLSWRVWESERELFFFSFSSTMSHNKRSAQGRVTSCIFSFLFLDVGLGAVALVWGRGRVNWLSLRPDLHDWTKTKNEVIPVMWSVSQFQTLSSRFHG